MKAGRLPPARLAFTEVPATDWEQGCFDKQRTAPLWEVAIYADEPLLHRVRVGDYDDQEYEAMLSPDAARALFDLLTGVGPLGYLDIQQEFKTAWNAQQQPCRRPA